METRTIEKADLDAVSIDDAMEHARITDDYDQVVVQMHLGAAHDIIEGYLNRQLSTTKMIGVEPEYRPVISLPYAPVTELQSVTCENDKGEEITLTKDVDYKFDDVLFNVRFITDQSKNSYFKFTFVCGYADGEVPRAVKHAVLMMFATLYESRENDVIGASTQTISYPAQRVCKKYRLRSM